MKNEKEFMKHEEIIKEIKRTIANIDLVKSFSITLNDEPKCNIGYCKVPDKILDLVTEEYYKPQYYVIDVISKDNIKYSTQVSTFGLELYVYKKGILKLCERIINVIQNYFNYESMIMKEELL